MNNAVCLAAEANTANTANTADVEADERDALMNEAAYAMRQTIDHATMLRGLMAMASWR